jgi:hypothetical protein
VPIRPAFEALAVDASGVNGSKRLVVVTAGNLRQNHFYIHEHLDFFPKDCIGPSRKLANGRAALLDHAGGHEPGGENGHYSGRPQGQAENTEHLRRCREFVTLPRLPRFADLALFHFFLDPWSSHA